MNTLEDRLRAATRAAAGTVADDSAPALRLPQPERRPGLPGRFRWIVPLAAAAAVIALIAVFATHAVMPGARRPVPPSEPIPSLADGLPAYFLEDPAMLTLNGLPIPVNSGPVPSRFRSQETLRVVATATGKVAATATLPGYVTAIAASRGAFFAAVVTGSRTRFYEIQLTAGYAGTTVTKLPIRPDTAPIAYLAASPDGAKLAYSAAIVQNGVYYAQRLIVASTAKDSEHEWTVPADYLPGLSEGSMGPMSWLPDDRTLAFNWSDQPTYDPGMTSLRLLDTEAPGSNLMASRAVPASGYGPFGYPRFTDYTTLSPNGQVVVGAASAYPANPAPQGSLLAVSTATGKPAVLFRASGGDRESGCYSPLLWISNTGSEVLAACHWEVKPPPTADYVVHVVLVNHDRVTKLPWLDAAAQWVMAFPAATASGVPAQRS
jgi:hypothetical protein